MDTLLGVWIFEYNEVLELLRQMVEYLGKEEIKTFSLPSLKGLLYQYVKVYINMYYIILL